MLRIALGTQEQIQGQPRYDYGSSDPSAFAIHYTRSRPETKSRRRLDIANEKVSLRLPADKVDSNTAISPAFVFDFCDRELPDFRC